MSSTHEISKHQLESRLRDAVCKTEALTLPSAPVSLSRLQAAFARRDATLSSIAALIELDPAMTMLMLRVANSPFYGWPRKVTRVKHAVGMLGLAEVERITVTTAVINGLMITDQACLRKFLAHSYTTALTARFLRKEHEPHLDPDLLWPTAMLHDIGRLVLLSLYPSLSAMLDTWAHDNHAGYIEAEEALGAPRHTELGAQLALQWNLPITIVDSCFHHEHVHPLKEPGTTETLGLRRIICSASMCASLSLDRLTPARREILTRRTCELLSIDSDTFNYHVLGSVADLSGDVAALLG